MRNISVRVASENDREKIESIIQFETCIHRYQDWRNPLYWLGDSHFLVAEKHNEIVAALSFPIEQPPVVWIRLFVSSSNLPVERVWRAIWTEAKLLLMKNSTLTSVMVMPLHRWYQTVLIKTDYQFGIRVKMFKWEGENPPEIKNNPSINIRTMKLEDLREIHKIDSAAFTQIWRYTLDTLEQALNLALFATVVQIQNRLVGYQISTISPIGGHLARLAVHPEYQGKGIGHSILQDLLHRFYRRGTRTITVNTQDDNAPSISLYKKAGFRPTGEEYPIMQFTLN